MFYFFRDDWVDDDFFWTICRTEESRAHSANKDLANHCGLILSSFNIQRNLSYQRLRSHTFIGDTSKYIAFLIDPITQTLIERLSIDRRNKITTITIGHPKSFIHSFERSSGIGTRHQTRDWIVTNADSTFTKLISEMIRTVNRRATLFGRICLR